MTETVVKADTTEAQRLYQRGLAAARSGQKRVAAGLLTRSVQLDPQNELAWLWLSGVLEDAKQQAFCLQAVLRINPNNQHAQRGLSLLEKRHQIDQVEAAPGLRMPAEEAVKPAREQHESWWVSWRRSRRDVSRARLLLWVFPLILVGLAIVLYESLSLAVSRTELTPTAAVVDVVAGAPEDIMATPTIEPILEAAPLSVVEGLTVAYLDAVKPVREQLRVATEDYRTATSQPGGSVAYVAATQRFHATVEQAIATFGTLKPPGTLEPAHADYLKGLELELEGLNAIMEFYSGYDVSNANRAAQRFQEARAYIDRAGASFASQSQFLAEMSAISSHTAR